jgi:hypothetical protein
MKLMIENNSYYFLQDNCTDLLLKGGWNIKRWHSPVLIEPFRGPNCQSRLGEGVVAVMKWIHTSYWFDQLDCYNSICSIIAQRKTLHSIGLPRRHITPHQWTNLRPSRSLAFAEECAWYWMTARQLKILQMPRYSLLIDDGREVTITLIARYNSISADDCWPADSWKYI